MNWLKKILIKIGLKKKCSICIVGCSYCPNIKIKYIGKTYVNPQGMTIDKSLWTTISKREWNKIKKECPNWTKVK
jgi:hypothetical protein